jgi:hypothetical protein
VNSIIITVARRRAINTVHRIEPGANRYTEKVDEVLSQNLNVINGRQCPSTAYSNGSITE